MMWSAKITTKQPQPPYRSFSSGGCSAAGARFGLKAPASQVRKRFLYSYARDDISVPAVETGVPAFGYAPCTTCLIFPLLLIASSQYWFMSACQDWARVAVGNRDIVASLDDFESRYWNQVI